MSGKNKQDTQVNIRGINQLLNNGVTKRELVAAFQVSRPFLDKLLAGQATPSHPGITLFINWQVKALLEK